MRKQKRCTFNLQTGTRSSPAVSLTTDVIIGAQSLVLWRPIQRVQRERATAEAEAAAKISRFGSGKFWEVAM